MAKFDETMSDPDLRNLRGGSSSTGSGSAVAQGVSDLASLAVDYVGSRRKKQAQEDFAYGLDRARSADAKIAEYEANKIREQSAAIPSKEEMLSGSDEEDAVEIAQIKKELNRIQQARISMASKALRERSFMAAQLNNGWLDSDDIRRAASATKYGADQVQAYQKLADASTIQETEMRKFLEEIPTGWTPDSYLKYKMAVAAEKQYEYSGDAQDVQRILDSAENDRFAASVMLTNSESRDYGQFPDTLQGNTDYSNQVISDFEFTRNAHRNDLVKKLGSSALGSSKKAETLKKYDEKTASKIAELRNKEAYYRQQDRENLETGRQIRAEAAFTNEQNFLNNMSLAPEVVNMINNLDISPENMGSVLHIMASTQSGTIAELEEFFKNYMARLGTDPNMSEEQKAELAANGRTAINFAGAWLHNASTQLARLQGRDVTDAEKSRMFSRAFGTSGNVFEGMMQKRYYTALAGNPVLQGSVVDIILNGDIASGESDSSSKGSILADGTLSINAIGEGLFNGTLEWTEAGIEKLKTRLPEIVSEVENLMQIHGVVPKLRDVDGNGDIKRAVPGMQELYLTEEDKETLRGEWWTNPALYPAAGLMESVVRVASIPDLEREIHKYNIALWAAHDAEVDSKEARDTILNLSQEAEQRKRAANASALEPAQEAAPVQTQEEEVVSFEELKRPSRSERLASRSGEEASSTKQPGKKAKVMQDQAEREKAMLAIDEASEGLATIDYSSIGAKRERAKYLAVIKEAKKTLERVGR